MYRYNRHVWRAKSLDKSEALVLLCLLDHCNEQGICWPSLNTLAEETKHTKQGVLKVLDRLREKGLVSWRVLPETGGRTYRVHLEALAALDSPEVNPVDQEVNLVDQGVNGVDRVRGVDTVDQVNPVYQGVNPVDQGGKRGLPEPSIEPPIEPSIKPSSSSPPYIPPQIRELTPDPLEATPTLPPTGKPNPDPLEEEEGGRFVSSEEGTAKAKGGSFGGGLPSCDFLPPSGRPNEGPLEISPAARDGTHKPAPGVAEVPARYRPPDPHTEVGARAVRALREAGLWERFSSLRRYARDWGLWQEWLHGPIARHYERLGEATFVQAVREALEGLATRPDLQRPLLWFEKVLQKAAPPPPSGESVVVPSLQSWEELENGELLRLPDGRVGYFAGWTAGGTKGFLEVEGTSYVLPRELLLQAEVLA